MASSKKNHKADSFPKDGPVDTSRRNLIKGAGMVGVAALGTSAENIIAQESSKERNINTMISREALEVLRRTKLKLLKLFVVVLYRVMRTDRVHLKREQHTILISLLQVITKAQGITIWSV